jgi:hypothetical protein
MKATAKRATRRRLCVRLLPLRRCAVFRGATAAICGKNVFSPTSFFVGAADDITPYQLAGNIARVYGDNPDLNKIADPAKLDQFYKEAEALPKPQINAKNDLALERGENIPSGLQLRFMGQRYIPDSEILQELCAPIVRPFPTGLDVLASLGSKRAADIIAAVYRPAETWPEYTKNFERMKASSLPSRILPGGRTCITHGCGR